LTAEECRRILTAVAPHRQTAEALLCALLNANRVEFKEAINMKTLPELLTEFSEETGLADVLRREGRAEGRVEGRVEGEAEGEARGKAEAAVAHAAKKKRRGLKPYLIAEITGLSLEAIAQL
jgi:predicted transposase YdaD